MKKLVVGYALCLALVACSAANPPPGSDGTNGVSGTNGTNGKDGANGKDGLNGTNGKDGDAGVQGPKGDPGLNGGADGKDGLPGAPGANGLPGAPGKDGLPGSPGVNGTNGTNGTNNKLAKKWSCDLTGNTVFLAKTWSVNAYISSCPMLVDVWYLGEETTSGDMFVRAGIDTVFVNAPTSSKLGSSSTEFWMAGTTNANNGANWLLGGDHEASCVVGSGTNNWSFALDKVHNSLAVSYSGAYANNSYSSASLSIPCIN